MRSAVASQAATGGLHAGELSYGLQYVMDCKAWNVPKAPAAQREVTRSEIPTLALAGGFDTLTAAESARFAASTLPNSHLPSIPVSTTAMVLMDVPLARVRVVPRDPAAAARHRLVGGRGTL
jgi:pimeloyl-ACP methyl ester carboxylesterase